MKEIVLATYPTSPWLFVCGFFLARETKGTHWVTSTQERNFGLGMYRKDDLGPLDVNFKIQHEENKAICKNKRKLVTNLHSDQTPQEKCCFSVSSAMDFSSKTQLRW